MKRFLILMTIALTCLSLFAVTAEARRFWRRRQYRQTTDDGSATGTKHPDCRTNSRRRGDSCACLGRQQMARAISRFGYRRWLGRDVRRRRHGRCDGRHPDGGPCRRRGDVPDLIVSSKSAGYAIFQSGSALQRTTTARIRRKCRACYRIFCLIWRTQYPGGLSGGNFFAQRQDLIHPPAGRE